MSETTTTNPATPKTTKAEPEMKLAVKDDIIAALDRATENGIFALTVSNQFKRMFMLGAVMSELKALLTPQVMQPVMALQNSPIGFLTDKKETGYPVDVVRAAIIEAAINGVSICGNEFNILAGRFYLTKNGLKHKLRDVEGLYKNVTPGIPKMVSEKGAIITMHLDWTFNGEKHEKDLTFAIRVNAGMGTDAIVGKATRKAYAWLYEEVTGNNVNEGDATDDSPIEVQAEVSPIEAELEKGKPATESADPAKGEAAKTDAESDLKLEQM